MNHSFRSLHCLSPAVFCCTTGLAALFAFVDIGVAADGESTVAAHDEYVYMIRFSRDGQAMVTAAGDNTAVIWDWPEPKKRHVLKHDAAVYAAVFSPDGRQVATASGDGFVTLWDAADGKQIRREKQHADAVYCIDYSGDGLQLASIGGHGRKGDTTCRVWTVASLSVAHSYPGHDRPAYGVRFAPNGKDVITSGGDKRIRLTGLADGESRELTRHTSDVYRFDMTADGRTLASTSQDSSVRVWDVGAGKVIALLQESKDPTYDVAFSADGKQLAVVGDDGTVRFWRTTDYTLTQAKKLASEGLFALAWTPDQQQVVAAGVDGQLYFTRSAER